MTEYTAAIRYAIAQLTAADITVFENLALDTTGTDPYVTVQRQANRNDEAVGVDAGGTDVLLLVKCWARSRSLAEVETLEEAVYEALVTTTPQVIGTKFQVLGCWKEDDLRDSEGKGDSLWQMLGGIYVVQMHRI